MFYDKFERLCNEKGIKPGRAADEMGISRATVTNWKQKGYDPRKQMLEKIAGYFGMTVDELLNGEKIETPDITGLSRLETMQKIPLIGTIACGTPILAEQNVEDFVDLPRHIQADFALNCQGDSMIDAGIKDGDVVYIRQQAMVENGQIAAVLVDGDRATLKRFYFDQPSGTVTLMAANPAYAPITKTGEDVGDVRVIVLAVAFTHPLI